MGRNKGLRIRINGLKANIDLHGNSGNLTRTRRHAEKRGNKMENNRLEEALATVLSTQATMQANQAAIQANMAAFQAQFLAMQGEIRAIETDRRAIEGQILTILKHHEQMLEALPEAVRDKIGFDRKKGT